MSDILVSHKLEQPEESKEPEELKLLSRWNPQSLKLDTLLGIFGPRERGKTTLVCELIRANLDKFENIVVICSSHNHEPYLTLSPDILVFPTFDQTVVAEVGNILAERTGVGFLNSLPLLVVMDDCMAAERQLFRTEEIRYLFKNPRHCRISLWLVAQYFGDLAPDVRGNLDALILFPCLSLKEQKKMYDFINPEVGRESFHTLCRSCIKDYRCLVNVRSTENELYHYRVASDAPERKEEKLVFNKCPKLRLIEAHAKSANLSYYAKRVCRLLDLKYNVDDHGRNVYNEIFFARMGDKYSQLFASALTWDWFPMLPRDVANIVIAYDETNDEHVLQKRILFLFN